MVCRQAHDSAHISQYHQAIFQEHRASILRRRAWPMSETKSLTIASSYERRTDATLRKLFPNHEFKKVRPEWLLNDYPGRKHPAQPLELDFFCERLMLAVEVQGEQHRFIVPAFHGEGEQARKALWAQQRRDQTKRDLCKKFRVDLVEVWFDQNIEHVLSSHPLIRQHLHSA
jgi:hypothetical protein